MATLEYVGNAGDGFMVHLSGRAPRFIEPHAFLSTFGVAAFEEHILSDAEVHKVTESTVICVPPRFPSFSVVWARDEATLDSDSGLVRFEGQPFTRVSNQSGGFTEAQEAVRDATTT